MNAFFENLWRPCVVFVVLFAWPVMAAVKVDCPGECLAVQALSRIPRPAELLNLSVTCRRKMVEVRLDFGSGRMVSRDVVQTKETCEQLPELIGLLLTTSNVATVRRRPASDTSNTTPLRSLQPARLLESHVGPRRVVAEQSPVVRQPQEVMSPTPSVEPAESTSGLEARPDATEPALLVPDPVQLPDLASLQPPRADVASIAEDKPVRGRASRSDFLGIDLGGGVHTGPFDAFGTLRLNWAPWAHLGALVEGSFSSSVPVSVGEDSATTERQAASLGLFASLLPAESWGPRLSAAVGVERVSGQGKSFPINRTDAAVGVVFCSALEWQQPVIAGIYARASVGAMLRPVAWVIRSESENALVWRQASFIGGLSLGWSPTKVWGQ